MKDREEYDEEEVDRDTRSVAFTFILFAIIVVLVLGCGLWYLLSNYFE